MEHELRVWVKARYLKQGDNGAVTGRDQNVVGGSLGECATVAEISGEEGEYLCELKYMGSYQDYLQFEARASSSTLAVGWVDIEEETGYESTK